jgi:hypothetical protein
MIERVIQLISVKEPDNTSSRNPEGLNPQYLTNNSVEICFSENAPELDEILTNYFIRLKQD